MRIVVIYNVDFRSANNQLGVLAGQSIEMVAEEVFNTLKNLGYNYIKKIAIRDLEDLKALNLLNLDMVFNLCETVELNPYSEYEIIKELEEQRRNFTGNSSTAILNCLDKFICCQRLKEFGVSVPKSYLIQSLDDINNIPIDLFKTYFIKPNGQDASIGIDQYSVVRGRDEIWSKCENVLFNCGGPILIQEFIEGREINLSFVGDTRNKYWNFSEIDFSRLDEKFHKILSYDSKWSPDSYEFQATKGLKPILSDIQKREMLRLGELACKALGLASYGRIDFRLDPFGNAYVIDVNPNCDLSINSGLSRSQQFENIDYPELIDAILGNAFKENYANYKIRNISKN